MFGPLRNLWEGKIIGEKIISSVKNEFLGFRPQWSRSLMQRMLNELALEKVKQGREVQTKYLPKQGFLKEGHYKMYQSHQLVKYTFTYNEALLVIRFANGVFATVIKGKKEVCEIKCIKYVAKHNNLCYFQWSVSDNITKLSSLSENGNFVSHYCLLLPFYDIDSSKTLPIFTLITSRWEIYSVNETIQKPTFEYR